MISSIAVCMRIHTYIHTPVSNMKISWACVARLPVCVYAFMRKPFLYRIVIFVHEPMCSMRICLLIIWYGYWYCVYTQAQSPSRKTWNIPYLSFWLFLIIKSDWSSQITWAKTNKCARSEQDGEKKNCPIIFVEDGIFMCSAKGVHGNEAKWRENYIELWFLTDKLTCVCAFLCVYGYSN